MPNGWFEPGVSQVLVGLFAFAKVLPILLVLLFAASKLVFTPYRVVRNRPSVLLYVVTLLFVFGATFWIARGFYNHEQGIIQAKARYYAAHQPVTAVRRYHGVIVEMKVGYSDKDSTQPQYYVVLQDKTVKTIKMDWRFWKQLYEGEEATVTIKKQSNRYISWQNDKEWHVTDVAFKKSLAVLYYRYHGKKSVQTDGIVLGCYNIRSDQGNSYLLRVQDDAKNVYNVDLGDNTGNWLKYVRGAPVRLVFMKTKSGQSFSSAEVGR